LEVEQCKRVILRLANTNITSLPDKLPPTIEFLSLQGSKLITQLPDLSGTKISTLILIGCEALKKPPPVPAGCLVLLPTHLAKIDGTGAAIPKTSVQALSDQLGFDALESTLLNDFICPITLASLDDLKDQEIVLVKNGLTGNGKKIILGVYSADAFEQLLKQQSAHPLTRAPLSLDSLFNSDQMPISYNSLNNTIEADAEPPPPSAKSELENVENKIRALYGEEELELLREATRICLNLSEIDLILKRISEDPKAKLDEKRISLQMNYMALLVANRDS